MRIDHHLISEAYRPLGQLADTNPAALPRSPALGENKAALQALLVLA